MKITAFKDIPKFTAPGRYAVDYPMDYLCRWIKTETEEMGLNLNPAFQRGHVWTEKQQQSYMEFLLRGGLTGRDLYFNLPSLHIAVPVGEYNDYVCVDGLQRLTAVQRFIGNEITVFGSYFEEFTDRLHLSMDTLRIHINDLKTEHEVLTWYLEMNSGGTPHTEREISRVRAMRDALRPSNN